MLDSGAEGRREETLAELNETIPPCQGSWYYRAVILTHHTQPFLPALPPHLDGGPAQSPSELYGTGRGRRRGQVPSFLLCPFGLGWLISMGNAFACEGLRGARGCSYSRNDRSWCVQGKQVKSSITHLSSLKCHQVSHTSTLTRMCCSLPSFQAFLPDPFLLA